MAMIGAVKLAGAAYHAGSKIDSLLGYTAETLGIGTVSISNSGWSNGAFPEQAQGPARRAAIKKKR